MSKPALSRAASRVCGDHGLSMDASKINLWRRPGSSASLFKSVHERGHRLYSHLAYFTSDHLRASSSEQHPPPRNILCHCNGLPRNNILKESRHPSLLLPFFIAAARRTAPITIRTSATSSRSASTGASSARPRKLRYARRRARSPQYHGTNILAASRGKAPPSTTKRRLR